MLTRLLLLLAWLGMVVRSELLFAATATTGQPAPTWALVDLDGQPIGSDRLAGQVILLNFFRTTCIPCHWEIPDLTRLQKTYGPQGLAVIGIAAQESADILQPFSQTQNISYPVCPSVDQMLWDYNVFPLGGIPLTVIIDRDGVVVDWYRYYQTYAFHETKLLPALRAGSMPRLFIARADETWELSWTAEAADFLVETRSSLASVEGWVLLPEKAEQVGEHMRVVVPRETGNAFFRLRQQ